MSVAHASSIAYIVYSYCTVPHRSSYPLKLLAKIIPLTHSYGHGAKDQHYTTPMYAPIQESQEDMAPDHQVRLNQSHCTPRPSLLHRPIPSNLIPRSQPPADLPQATEQHGKSPKDTAECDSIACLRSSVCVSSSSPRTSNARTNDT